MLRNAQIAFFGESQFGLGFPKSQAFRVHLQPAIERFVGSIEIALHLVVQRQVLKYPTVLGIEAGRFLEIARRFLPFSQATLDRAEGEINFGLVG